MMVKIYVSLIVCLPLLRCILSYNPFDDSMLYDISWAGPFQQQNERDSPVFITTKDNEKYRCALPVIRADLQECTSNNFQENKGIINSRDRYEPGPGLSADELLKPLTTHARCSYRLETYWTYELCHGSHIRQYHDEKPQKNKAIQEYMLGKVSKESTEEKNEKTQENVQPEQEKIYKKVPKRSMNGREVPYYEVVMDNGTPCELLNRKPRKTHILYMCKPDSHNEIISIKEIQSCEYQFEVLTPLLCASDAYKIKEDITHQIRCHSLDGSPREPHSYREHIEESEADRLGYREYQYMPVTGESPEADPPSDEHRKIPPQPDQQLTKDFLNGDYCLRGGSGWWHYEYCHSKHVFQYHEDSQGKTIVYLGTWNEDVHIEWAKTHPKHKTAEYMTHYYGNGDICDVTGMARTVQVKLRCMKTKHLQEVSIYLLEPKPCQYVLGVDSPILCPLIERADENGIFAVTP